MTNQSSTLRRIHVYHYLIYEHCFGDVSPLLWAYVWTGVERGSAACLAPDFMYVVVHCNMWCRDSATMQLVITNVAVPATMTYEGSGCMIGLFHINMGLFVICTHHIKYIGVALRPFFSKKCWKYFRKYMLNPRVPDESNVLLP